MQFTNEVNWTLSILWLLVSFIWHWFCCELVKEGKKKTNHRITFVEFWQRFLI
jgi:hypothetical protein